MNPPVDREPPCGVELIEPEIRMAQAYGKFLQEFIDAGEEGILHTVPDRIEDAGVCVRKLKDYAEGRNLPEGWVISSAYWLLSDDGRLLGEIHIRHYLTPSLEDYGGHIGYMVRPGERGKSYATKMLAMALEKSRTMGLKKVMVTCEQENVASARVIQKNGGRLISESVAKIGRLTSRYWIDL